MSVPEPIKVSQAPLQEIDITKIDPKLQELIAQIVPSPDPLDDPKFNPVDYINNLFPTEQSLSDIDDTIKKLKVKINRADEEIVKAIREQIPSGSKGKQDLDEAKKAIQELFAKIKDIKSKAEKSEKMVTEICKDIKSLDYAKRNLTATITGLKRLHMLVTAVDQLQVMASKRQYGEAGHLLEAVNQFVEHFANYMHIAKIEQTVNTVKKLKQELKTQIYEEFEKFLEGAQTYTSTNQLTEACVVIDALGKDARKDFMTWFCSKQLGEYNRYFRAGEESAGLEHTERRFNWLKRYLKIYDEQYSKIFPPEWKITELFYEEFCFATTQHLGDVLEAGRHNLNVDTLIASLQRTIEFENEMSQRFSTAIIIEETVVEPPPVQSGSENDGSFGPGSPTLEEEEAMLNPQELSNPHSAAAIRARWRQHQKERQKQPLTVKKKREINKFKGIISAAFDLYMDFYTKKEDQNMRDLLNKIIAAETWSIDDEERNKVLASSTDLMFYFKVSMKTCSSLNQKQGLFDLYKLFKKYLSEYAAILSDKIPTPDTKLTEAQEKMLCLIVNTGEFCSSRTVALVKRLKELINPSFADKIEMENEKNEYESVIAKGIQALVSGLIVKTEGSLLQMTKMPWGSWENVGDTSEYVNQISTYINQAVPLYINWISSQKNLQFFCDSFTAEFVPLLISYIHKCRKISETGGQQLMLDLNVLKTLLLELPNIGRSQPIAIPARYSGRIQKAIGKAELLLKLIGLPLPKLVETYKTLVPEGSESDFQKILELRGLSRAEQKSLMDSFNLRSDSKLPVEKKLTGTNLGQNMLMYLPKNVFAKKDETKA